VTGKEESPLSGSHTATHTATHYNTLLHTATHFLVTEKEESPLVAVTLCPT